MSAGLIFSLISNSQAQNGWSIAGGVNYSSFYDEEDNGWIPGISFGIGNNEYEQINRIQS